MREALSSVLSTTLNQKCTLAIPALGSRGNRTKVSLSYKRACLKKKKKRQEEREIKRRKKRRERAERDYERALGPVCPLTLTMSVSYLCDQTETRASGREGRLTFRILVVENTVRVQRERSGSKVHQVDNDHVSHFCPQDGTQKPQPGGFGNLRGVAPICEVSINRLLVDPTYPVGPSLQK